jgi:UDP-glucuronate decarboxylase
MAADDGRVVSNFIVQALKGEPLTVYGDGTQTRSFCYVDDLIEGFIKLFFKEGLYQPINLGNPEPINMLELAKEIIELTGSESKIEMRELPGDDPKQREPNIEKAKVLLGWYPQIPRVHGLKETLAYFSNVQECGSS